MTELHAGGASTRQIAALLTAEGHPTKRGGQWSSATVSRILEQSHLMGCIGLVIFPAFDT